jgi:hypothetical protein
MRICFRVAEGGDINRVWAIPRLPAGPPPGPPALRLIGLPTAGAVRVSFGLASTVGDVERFVDFADATYRDRRPDTTGLPPRDRC